jgi:hypothetical protein
MRQATRPWNCILAKRGRPRKSTAEGLEGCVWPIECGEAGDCGGLLVDGLALCPEHAREQSPGRTCVWPGCEQTGPFQAICAYHMKRAIGLLGAFRP